MPCRSGSEPGCCLQSRLGAFTSEYLFQAQGDGKQKNQGLGAMKSLVEAWELVFTEDHL